MKIKRWITACFWTAVMAMLIPVGIHAEEGNPPAITLDGRPYDTLQSALAEAQNGSVITIGEGTVKAEANEQLRVTADNLTIRGAGPRTVIDTGKYSVSGQAGILVQADNVTIEDLSVVSSSEDGNVSALKFSQVGTDQGITLLESGTVSNVTVSSERGHALNIHGVRNMTVEDLTVSKAGKCGIAVALSQGVRISRSRISNVGWAHIGMMYRAGSLAYADASEIILESGNVFEGNVLIYSERPSSAGADRIAADEDSGLVMITKPDGTWGVVSDNPDNPAPALNRSTGLLYPDLDLALSAAGDGETVRLMRNVSLGRMLDIAGKSNLTLDLNGKTITAAEDFHGTDSAGRYLLQVRDSAGVVISGGSLKTAPGNGSVLNIHTSDGVVLRDLTLDHQEAMDGSPLEINGSHVTVSGDFGVIAGPNSMWGIGLDNRDGSVSLNFGESAEIHFSDNSGRGLDYICARDSSTDESVPAPSVTSQSDTIRFDGDDGIYNLHVHTPSGHRQGVKEAGCTEEGYTGDIVCTGCGEVLEKGQVIARTDHIYENGICTVCGEDDPHKKPEESVPAGETETVETTADQESSSGEESPVTGDGSLQLMWVILFIMSGCVLIPVLLRQIRNLPLKGTK